MTKPPRLHTLRPRVATLDIRRVKTPEIEKISDPFYYSRPWRNLLEVIFAKRGRRCEDPTCRTPRGPWKIIYGDHVIERRDGGAELDENNVKLRCGPCHGRKTYRERVKRESGPTIG